MSLNISLVVWQRNKTIKVVPDSITVFLFDDLNCETTWQFLRKKFNTLNLRPFACNPERHWLETELCMGFLDFVIFVFHFRRNTPEHQNRVTDITEQIHRTGGLYDMTYDELCFGAKTAWRNAPRCIGRIQWNNLKVQICYFWSSF